MVTIVIIVLMSNDTIPATSLIYSYKLPLPSFRAGITVYKGYVDDPRNTDNSWIETLAVNYHDSIGTSFSNFPLQVPKYNLPKKGFCFLQNSQHIRRCFIHVHVYLDLSQNLNNFSHQAEGDSLGVQWIAIKENIDLYANHEWIIEKVN